MTGPVVGGAALTPLEIASGVVVGPPSPGFDPVGDLGSVEPGSAGLVAAMEDVMLPLLGRSPCLITFSGGMDSSFVLAVALRAALRHGLPAPVPVTWRFPADAPDADETARQDSVLAALGNPERMVMQADEDLDFLGPVAREVYERHGPRYPANLYVHAPFITAARGGSVLTGFGGDQVLGGHGPPAHTAHHGLRSIARDGVATLPMALRVRLRVRRSPQQRPWLHSEHRKSLDRELAVQALSCPTDPWERIRFRCDNRATELAVGSLCDLAAASDVRIGNPFLHPGVQERVATAARRAPLRRAGLLRMMADGELPDVVTQLHPKARFQQVFRRSFSRAFQAGWTGEGVDPDLVDASALRAFWRDDPMSTDSALLDQQLALADRSAPRTHR